MGLIKKISFIQVLREVAKVECLKSNMSKYSFVNAFFLILFHPSILLNSFLSFTKVATKVKLGAMRNGTLLFDGIYKLHLIQSYISGGCLLIVLTIGIIIALKCSLMDAISELVLDYYICVFFILFPVILFLFFLKKLSTTSQKHFNYIINYLSSYFDRDVDINSKISALLASRHEEDSDVNLYKLTEFLTVNHSVISCSRAILNKKILQALFPIMTEECKRKSEALIKLYKKLFRKTEKETLLVLKPSIAYWASNYAKSIIATIVDTQEAKCRLINSEYLIDEIKRLIADTKYDRAMDELWSLGKLLTSQKKQNEIIILISQYNALAPKQRLGILSKEERKNLSSIMSNILSFLRTSLEEKQYNEYVNKNYIKLEASKRNTNILNVAVNFTGITVIIYSIGSISITWLGLFILWIIFVIISRSNAIADFIDSVIEPLYEKVITDLFGHKTE